ncbi:unnamed protein product [Pedinophyceae sp. YPF-701]|nr:unnamed protein product [Pedinophyceae sp. YPF-701]
MDAGPDTATAARSDRATSSPGLAAGRSPALQGNGTQANVCAVSGAYAHNGAESQAEHRLPLDLEEELVQLLGDSQNGLVADLDALKEALPGWTSSAMNGYHQEVGTSRGDPSDSSTETGAPSAQTASVSSAASYTSYGSGSSGNTVPVSFMGHGGSMPGAHGVRPPSTMPTVSTASTNGMVPYYATPSTGGLAVPSGHVTPAPIPHSIPALVGQGPPMQQQPSLAQQLEAAATMSAAAAGLPPGSPEFHAARAATLALLRRQLAMPPMAPPIAVPGLMGAATSGAPTSGPHAQTLPPDVQQLAAGLGKLGLGTGVADGPRRPAPATVGAPYAPHQAAAAAAAMAAGRFLSPTGSLPHPQWGWGFPGAEQGGVPGLVPGLDHMTSLAGMSPTDFAARLSSTPPDPQACRVLQRMVEDGGSSTVAEILPSVLQALPTVADIPAGSGLMLKVLERCTDAQRMAIIRHLVQGGHLAQLAMRPHGTRTVQQLVQGARGREQGSLLASALQPEVLQLIRDVHGSHVLQRCLQRLDPADSAFVFHAVLSHCSLASTDRHGCCVVQRCIDYATPANRQALMALLAAVARMLSESAFGNYVVQYVLDQGQPDTTIQVMQQLTGHYARLSTQKYASNVVEKCLRQQSAAVRPHRDAIIQELMDSPSFPSMLLDQYGNYVVQSALAVASGPLAQALVDAIQPHAHMLHRSAHGKRILSRIQRKAQAAYLAHPDAALKQPPRAPVPDAM